MSSHHKGSASQAGLEATNLRREQLSEKVGMLEGRFT